MFPSTPAANADLDGAAIADAATRLKMLQRLADLGMRLAEEICERAINAPYYPEPRYEPGRAFANISRAVRLTLVLQEKTEIKLIALRKGETPPAEPPARARVERPAEAALDETSAGAPETPDRSRETLRERESERFDDLLDGPFDDCVAAIRADIGIEQSARLHLGRASGSALLCRPLAGKDGAAGEAARRASNAKLEQNPLPLPDASRFPRERGGREMTVRRSRWLPREACPSTRPRPRSYGS